ncbi:MAG: cell division protein FtsK [Treponema sp.]|nr:cell division protein FtsK [Treponema sp.]
MKPSANKTNLFSGIVLLVLAAFFTIALMTQPLEALGASTEQIKFLWYIGNMIFSVYGFSSLLIPGFFLVSGLACFASAWTARRSMRLLTAIVPFFTAVITENICKSFLLYPSDYNGVKVAVTLITGAALITIEILGAGVLADRINDRLFDKDGKLKKVERKPKVKKEESEENDLNELTLEDIEDDKKTVKIKSSRPRITLFGEGGLFHKSNVIDELEIDEESDSKNAVEEVSIDTAAGAEEKASESENRDVFDKALESIEEKEEPEEDVNYSSASSLITQEEFSALTQPAADELVWDNVPPAPETIPEDYIDEDDGFAPGTDPDEMELPEEDPYSAANIPAFETPASSNEEDPFAIANELDHMQNEYVPEQEETVWANEDAYYNPPEMPEHNEAAQESPFSPFDDGFASVETPAPDEEVFPEEETVQNEAVFPDEETFFDESNDYEEEPVIEDETTGEPVINEEPVIEEEPIMENEPEVVENSEPYESPDLPESEEVEKAEDRNYGSVTDTGTFNIASDIFSDMDDELRMANDFQVAPRDANDLTADELTAFFNAQQAANTPNRQGIEDNLPKGNRAQKKGPYQVPSNLLTEYVNDQYWIIDDETKAASLRLKETLSEFGIEAEITGIKKGPVITMFELLPASGVKLSKIVGLQDNIALSLAAQSVRIVAPIPGKQAVGIEVPNKDRSIVGFRELIEQPLEEFRKMAVPVILGKDILGKSQIMDLVKTPHLLIAGATGAGKSVCVNSIILSILYKRSPQEVKMILIDPKVVELKLYNNIPHLLTPVITEPKKAFQALQYCLCEMERRYALLDNMGVRDISNYNRKIVEKKICTEKLPYMVVIIDEFADLMATTGKQLESTVARLAAMSRAVGIHLVLATQRPSVNVITGLIKANIPSRIAFMVASRTDSSIIIDSPGAEKLLGRGDMLYASAVDPYPVRIQGTFVSDQEVENVVEYVKQYGEPDYIDDEIFVDDEDEGQGELFGDNEDLGDDPLYDQALEIVVQAGKASASYIQRRLKIGYNRAARLVEEMEERGIVGPANGSKPREVIHMP